MMFKELFDLSLLNDSIPFVGLSTRLKHWRIKHPRVVTDQGQSVPHPEMPDSFRAFFIDLFFGGMGREPKNTPPLCLPWSALLCGYPIRLCAKKHKGIYYDLHLHYCPAVAKNCAT